MKTRRLSTIMMSAYLSAMLASSLAPMAGNLALAGTVNPSAAQAAYRDAVNSLDATWLAATTASVATAPEPQVAISRSTPPSDPIMSEELLGRILKLLANQTRPGSIPPEVCVLFKMCDGTAKLPVRMIQTDNPKGSYMTVKWEGPVDDIVIARRMADGSLHFFLTDKTLKLRAAAISENGVGRLVLNETLVESYKATAAHLAREAELLPPTGTAVASGAGS